MRMPGGLSLPHPWTRSRTPLSGAFDDHQGHVVHRGCRPDKARERLVDSVSQPRCRPVHVPAHYIDQSGFSKLFARVINRFGYAIAIDDQNVTGAEVDLALAIG